ncbi:HAD family hydrolase [Pasteurella multocida]|uniref:HAD family hydrolase n=1 Tax=Pasteurella multocida TaxID=747 RepID=UPI002B26E2A3|nr:HAD family phosphatase [Pasteurella multocida]
MQHFNLPTTTQRLADTILNHAYHTILQEGKPMLGLYELLHFLKARHIKMAVATSSFPKIIQAVFDKLKLWGYFILQCSADDEQFGKPYPAVYLKTIQKLGISSKECLVIEDSVVGLIAAKAANLRTFIVNTHYQNAQFAIADARLPTRLDVIKKLEDD